METLPTRYAKALYFLGLENDKLKDYQEQVKEIMKLLKQEEGLITVLGSYFLSHEDRKRKIDEIFSKYFDKEIVNFLKIIVDNDRINQLENILSAFNSMANDYYGVREGIIYSTYKLDESEISKVAESVGKKEGKKIYLINRINPNLLGGIKVVVEDHVYDGSLASKVDGLKKALLS